MEKQTQAYKNLLLQQSEEPLITYLSSNGLRVFGTKRFGVASVYITNTLRGANKHYIELLKDKPVDIILLSGYKTTGYEILLLEEML